MKCFRLNLLLRMAVCIMVLTACNNNRDNSTDANGTTKSTDSVDTRRNSTDTTNYITKDTGNKSQDVIDMDPPQNSRY